MLVSLFDYDLPPERIALQPASPRESARMLVVGANGALTDRHIADFPTYLRSGDALVVNDTRVIAARLAGVRARGEAIAHFEATLIKRVDARRWRALVRPAKKLKVGERVRFGEGGALDADVEAKGDAGEILFAFDREGADLDGAIEALGEIPLPPYIAARRAPGEADRQDYQTVFATQPGAVAAPTAGLHFTPASLDLIATVGVSLHRVTLHVGAGTFLPVKVEDIRDHVMHSEWARLDAATADALNAVRKNGGRIVAVGTTSLRTLESAAGEDGRINPFCGETSIFITPGYSFKVVDLLLTNFHLPRSTLLMMVGAFSGLETIRAAYAHAIGEKYRFYSYGDACLLERSKSRQP